MAIAWFICPYKRRITGKQYFPQRYCAMDDFTSQINADGGKWSETEVLGSVAIVKVRASDITLATIAAETGFHRLPKNRLDDSLSDLTTAQKNAIRNKLTDMGYTLQELHDALGNDLGAVTLRQVLKFATTRRLKPRYDSVNDAIVCDGDIQPVKALELVDQEIV